MSVTASSASAVQYIRRDINVTNFRFTSHNQSLVTTNEKFLSTTSESSGNCGVSMPSIKLVLNSFVNFVFTLYIGAFNLIFFLLNTYILFDASIKIDKVS